MNINNALTAAIKVHVCSLTPIERLAFKKAAHQFIDTIDDDAVLKPVKYESFSKLIRDQLEVLKNDGAMLKLNISDKTAVFARPYICRQAGKLEIKVETKTLHGHLHVKRIK